MDASNLFTMSDVSNSMNHEKLTEFKNRYFSHRNIRNAFDTNIEENQSSQSKEVSPAQHRHNIADVAVQSQDRGVNHFTLGVTLRAVKRHGQARLRSHRVTGAQLRCDELERYATLRSRQEAGRRSGRSLAYRRCSPRQAGRWRSRP